MEPASGKRSACLLARVWETWVIASLVIGNRNLHHTRPPDVIYPHRSNSLRCAAAEAQPWLAFPCRDQWAVWPRWPVSVRLMDLLLLSSVFSLFFKTKKNVKCETCLHHLVKRHTHTRRGKARHTHAVRRWWIRLVVSHLALSLFRPAAPAFDLTSRQADRQAKKRWRNEN